MSNFATTSDINELSNEIIPLIPEDGRRISNEKIQDALEKAAGEPVSDMTLKQIKARIIELGIAEAAKGPGGGLKAIGVETQSKTKQQAEKDGHSQAPTRTNHWNHGFGTPLAQSVVQRCAEIQGLHPPARFHKAALRHDDTITAKSLPKPSPWSIPTQNSYASTSP